ncbi:hypothetical protein XANCAGTX0491_008772 [Xanthoria calcicola]
MSIENGTMAPNPLGAIIDPPEGFSMSISRAGPGKHLFSRDIYSATLHALLHFSLLSYEAKAEAYNTRGSEPPGVVLASVLPFATAPLYTTLNCHVAWGLYWSVIAFNNPENNKESAATISIAGRRTAVIRYLQAAQAPAAVKHGNENATASLSYVSASQMLRANDNVAMKTATLMPDALGYRLQWVVIPGSEALRRETAYDTIAYAILWTAQYNEDMRFTGSRSIAFPGGRVFIRLESYQIGRWVPLTYGFAATVIKVIPTFLEAHGKFEEALFQVLTPDGQICGSVGIFIRDDVDTLETIDTPDSGTRGSLDVVM